VIWNAESFKVDSFEYSGQWIAILGTHVQTNFSCAVVGVYARCSIKDRRLLWEEIIILQASFGVPLFLVGDFNETLHQSDRSSNYLNQLGAREFRDFISGCNFLEYPLNDHRYTCFRG